MAKISPSIPTREEFVSFINLMQETMNMKESHVLFLDKKEILDTPELIRDKYKVLFESIWDERLNLFHNRICKQPAYNWFFNKDKNYDLSIYILKSLPDKRKFIEF